jgi:hypothetical protein
MRCPCRRRLLPLIIEHTIDERSPLIGHTFDSLMAVRAPSSSSHEILPSSPCCHGCSTARHELVLTSSSVLGLCCVGMLLFLFQHGRWPAAQVNAEIIVTFEGTTEFGNPFMARQSYLPTEIHWGARCRPLCLMMT